MHITGSDKTYDAVVFGTGAEGARRKAADRAALDKPVTAELGNVSPVIIVPGRWSVDELLYQAEHVATMLVNNAGFNCLAARVIVTHADWPQRDAFLGALTQALAQITTRRAYYPGAADRRAAFVAAHPEAEELGTRTGRRAAVDLHPWCGARDGPTTSASTWSRSVGECAETALTAPSPAAFVDAATAFCNDVRVGHALGHHPGQPVLTDATPAVSDAVERAVADLRYGAIGVNVWHALAFAIGTTTWGAYPGHPRNDIGSGSGVVGNAAMFDRPQKSVVRGPFRARPKPPWFATATGSVRGHAPRRRLRGGPGRGQDPRPAAAASCATDPGPPEPGRRDQTGQVGAAQGPRLPRPARAARASVVVWPRPQAGRCGPACRRRRRCSARALGQASAVRVSGV